MNISNQTISEDLNQELIEEADEQECGEDNSIYEKFLNKVKKQVDMAYKIQNYLKINSETFSSPIAIT